MLTYHFLNAIVVTIGTFFSVLLGFFGLSNVTALPFGFEDYFVPGLSNFHYLVSIIPPLELLYGAFVWVIWFKVYMVCIRVFIRM